MTIDNQPPPQPEQPAPHEIHTDGDYVARDKIVLEHEVQGDKFEIHLPRTAPSALYSLPAAPASTLIPFRSRPRCIARRVRFRK